MHIIFDFLCLGQDEVMIERLTNSLFQLFKDNTSLLTEIKGE